MTEIPAFGLNRFDYSTPQAFAADVRRAEELGWDYAFIPSSPLLLKDPYVNLAFAAVVEPESMKLVPLFAALFLFARIVFLLGYLRAPMWRTPGYALTFYPTLVVALYASYRVVVG